VAAEGLGYANNYVQQACTYLGFCEETIHLRVCWKREKSCGGCKNPTWTAPGVHSGPVKNRFRQLKSTKIHGQQMLRTQCFRPFYFSSNLFVPICIRIFVKENFAKKLVEQ
jgi:hypothetical protein